MTGLLSPAFTAPFLARGEQDWVRLVVFGLLFLGWVIKTVLDNARERQRRKQQREAPEEPLPEEQVPHTPRPTSRIPPAPPRPAPEMPPIPQPPRRRTQPTEGETAGRETVERESGERPREGGRAGRPSVATFPPAGHAAPAKVKVLPSQQSTQESTAYDHGLGSLAASDAAIAGETERRREALLRRLGGGGEKVRTERDLARAGYLWSEIFGTPRSETGPYRPPTYRRRHPPKM